MPQYARSHPLLPSSGPVRFALAFVVAASAVPTAVAGLLILADPIDPLLILATLNGQMRLTFFGRRSSVDGDDSK